jgi:hypothetical protein
MAINAEARRPVDQWVKDHPGQLCRGDERQALLAHLKPHLPHKTPEKLNNTLTKLLGNTHGIIHPEYTNDAYDQKALGGPTDASKEVKNVQAAAMKQQRREGAFRLLEAKGFKDKILSDLQVEELVEAILTEERRGRSSTARASFS